MSKPKVESSRILYSGFFDVRQDLLHREGVGTTPYTSLLLSNAVATIAQTREGLWVVNREYRHPTGEYLLSCPGGRLEKEEDPMIGAQRELYEETGYWSDEMVLIGCCYPAPGLCDQKIFYFHGRNAYKKGEQRLDPFEFIQTELMTEEQLHDEIRLKQNVDAALCTALWYKDHFC
jgi:ADP-ribose pyrophosphatase